MIGHMIDIKEIEKLAALSRLAVSPEEKEALRKDIDSILGYIDQIKKATVSGVVLTQEIPDVRNIMREDTDPHESGLFTEDLLAAAPAREKNYLKVKKIL
jgi:aspartyl-tRNA(Asn)/glutamyl-tRNA(Gln) amidotransferase subunit C